MNTYRALKSIVVAATLTGLGGVAHASFIDTIEGAKYTLDWGNSGTVYTFTYKADFTGYTGSTATNQDYALAISLATIPGNVDWTAGSITAAPGTTVGDWGIYQGVVANSNGCPAAGSAGKDWCIGLKGSSLAGQQLIDTTSVLTWIFTMNLTAGTPDFDGDPAWSYKFVTTNGTYANNQWEFGNYQISRTLSLPEDPPRDPPGTNVPIPGTLALLGLGLVGLGFRRRPQR